MTRYFSADYIFPVTKPPLRNGVLAVSSDGRIEAIYEENSIPSDIKDQITRLEGAIVPGFVNSHCHLELSHMLGKIPEHTGLVKFIKSILQFRAAEDEAVVEAASKADSQMYENGIVAVGDIANRTITAGVKKSSKLYYHTFLEVLGFKSEEGEAIFQDALTRTVEYHPTSVSVTPHAPYSVSDNLFAAIANHAKDNLNRVSIHNQETLAEQHFFETNTGDFLEFFDFIGIDVSGRAPSGTNSLKFHLPKLPANQPTLLVHNTFTSEADLLYAGTIHEQLYWCLCPNANLYIENNLPDAAMLEKQGAKITLGTDSLSSNHELNILSEMLTLQQHKQIAFGSLLKWATWNGAEFLGITDQVGSIEVGKTPGLNLIEMDADQRILNKEVKKIA